MPIQISSTGSPDAAPAPFALWALGFRPFYLLASAYAALAIPIWAAQSLGWIARRGVNVGWHAHEMLFGFALAVIAGFLFTAVRNWTGRPTPTGAPLMAIAALWVAGRIAVLTPWPLVAALVNAAFPLAVAVGIGVPIVRSNNRRNYFFIAILVAVAIATLVVQLAPIATIDLPATSFIRAMADLVLFVVVVMGGRVIPMFTNNGVPGAQARRNAALEKIALALVLAILALDLFAVGGAAFALLLAAAAAAHALRWWLWQPAAALRTPLVWSLHVAYLWIPVHLALRAASELGLVAPSLATHALTVGAIGGMIAAMITRTAKGHTGRLLTATRLDVVFYVLVLAAALLRVAGPLLVPALHSSWIMVSALAWSAAFALYAIGYWPALSRARLDGKPG